MTKLNALQKASLTQQFGERVSFQETERRLYGHDIAAMPGLVKPIIGSTIPEAVVQPETEEELVRLVKWARQERVPLTPRGMATSGYGGVLPVKKGVVVDFHRMNGAPKVDTRNETVTVQPGVIWERLDHDLQKHGLTLRLYPTSYPASTVGGWLAQGGAGIGSYEMGWFRDNVTSARVVQPDGTIRDFRGSDLDLVSDAEGTTGLISSVSLRVQPNERIESRAVATASAGDLQQTLEWITENKLPLWSMLFINPRMAALRNQLPTAHPHHGPPEERVILPEKYILLLTYRAKDRVAMSEALRHITERPVVELLPDAIADHEWENRFKLLMVKRLGPSLVPSEIVVPLSKLGAVMTEIESKIRQPVVKEGIVVSNGRDGKPEVVILGFIPSDERKLSYNFIFGLSLSIFKIAERHGGRAYATGLYFTGKAKSVLGADRIGRLAALKVEIDPENILNPGKVMGKNVAARFVGLASKVEFLIRPLGNRAVSRVGERPTRAIRGIPADVAWYAYACSQCGYCVSECNQFYGRGWESQSPRGKWYWLRQYMEGREKLDQSMVDTLIGCTTCELCDNRCGTGLPIEASWMKVRGELIHEQKRMTFPPFEMMSAALRKEGDIWAGYRKDRANWFPGDLKSKHGPEHKAKAVYFAGCTASYVEHDIAVASVRLLDAAQVDFTYLAGKENCCGTPMLVAGKWDVFAEVVKANVKAVQDAGADKVITSCPACDMMWRQVYPQWAKKLGIDFNITTRHYSEVAAERLKTGELVFPDNGHKQCTVTWHDSCHMGRAQGVYEPPRELIKALPA